MGRWVAVTEGSSSCELPLSPPSPKPPPQASVLLRPPLLRGPEPRFRSLHGAAPASWGCGCRCLGRAFLFRQWPPTLQRLSLPRADGLRTRVRSAGCGETPRTHVLSGHPVDTARPPGGGGGPLGPRPKPKPRPRLRPRLPPPPRPRPGSGPASRLRPRLPAPAPPPGSSLAARIRPRPPDPAPPQSRPRIRPRPAARLQPRRPAPAPPRPRPPAPAPPPASAPRGAPDRVPNRSESPQDGARRPAGTAGVRPRGRGAGGRGHARGSARSWRGLGGVGERGRARGLDRSRCLPASGTGDTLSRGAGSAARALHSPGDRRGVPGPGQRCRGGRHRTVSECGRSFLPSSQAAKGLGVRESAPLVRGVLSVSSSRRVLCHEVPGRAASALP